MFLLKNENKDSAEAMSRLQESSFPLCEVSSQKVSLSEMEPKQSGQTKRGGGVSP